MNDEIALERWHQARARNEARKRDGGGAAAEEDEDAPAHGIRGWHLAVPSWAELPTKARKSKAALRRAAAARRWQDEEADVLASGCVTRSFEGAVTMVDTVHDAFCVVDGDCYVPASANAKDDDDWAAAPLRVGDVLSVRAAHRPQGRNKWTAYRAERVSRAPPGKARRGREKRVERHVRRPRAVEERRAAARGAAAGRAKAHDQPAPEVDAAAMRASVAAGLAAAESRAPKKTRHHGAAACLPVAADGAAAPAAEPSVLGVLTGDAALGPRGAVEGRSEFCSVAVAGCEAVKDGRWYYEVELGTDGVVQVGWAGADFGADDGAGDGVGDDAHSWGFDGCRGRAWTAGAAEAYGGAEGWKKGDVVGCRVDVDKGEASFSVNGADLGVAFRGVAGPLSAALSLEDGEAVRVALDRGDLRFGPPAGYRALGDARLAPLAEDQEEAPAAAPAPASAPPRPAAAAVAPPEPPVPAALPAPHAPPAPAPAPPPPPKKAPYVKGPPVAAAALDLGPFETAEALEALGLDRLKSALMAAGLKCGGTLRDRAERLLSTRGKDRADWDPKILAKPKKKG